jgi:hypothetical protein
MLAKRLTQRGVVFSGGSVTAVLSAGAASGSAPPALVASTIKAASLLAAGQAAGVVSAKVAALTEETVKAMFVNKLKAVLAVVLVIGLAFGGIGLGIGFSTNPVAMAQTETPKEAPVKKESPTSPVATGKDAAKGREGIQVETKDKPLVVLAVLESVDAQGARITAKWVTGSDANAALKIFVAKGEALDPRWNYYGYQLGAENLQKVMDSRPRFVNVPVRSDAKIVKEKLQLREDGNPSSLQLTKETVQRNELRAGRVVSLQLAPDSTTGFGIVGIGVVEIEKK